ncbi:MAG: CYTH domain-containing protein [Gemmatimonadota bacterium]
MAHEIERKFLIVPGAWRPDPARGMAVRQGYLSHDPARTVRVRVTGTQGFITIKGITRGISRLEFEYPIPVTDAEALLAKLCIRPLIEKRRYRELYGGWTWEIDVFEGENAGLIVAEVELPTELTTVTLPSWVGREVSDDPRYFNSNLARHPYSLWGSDA